MRTLRKLGATVSIALALTISAMAAENPPCGTEPGQIPTPPCAMQLATVNTAAGSSVAASNTATPVPNETSLTRIAADVLLSFLPLF